MFPFATDSHCYSHCRRQLPAVRRAELTKRLIRRGKAIVQRHFSTYSSLCLQHSTRKAEFQANNLKPVADGRRASPSRQAGVEYEMYGFPEIVAYGGPRPFCSIEAIISLIDACSRIIAITDILPPHSGQQSTSISYTLAKSLAQALRLALEPIAAASSDSVSVRTCFYQPIRTTVPPLSSVTPDASSMYCALLRNRRHTAAPDACPGVVYGE